MRPEDLRASAGGIVRATRRPPGWQASGPKPPWSDALAEDARAPASSWPREGEDLCWLAGDFRILQRLEGHRWSLDDLMTAWLAAQVMSAPKTICDLGCGIGTVLLFLAWRFPDARLVGIEAQADSAALARRSLAWNAVVDRAVVRDGDIRDAAMLDLSAFELVSGTPPYFPPGTGVESSRPQCAPCRFEHRGGVEVYVDAIARVLAPGGRAVICQGTIQAMRVAPAVERAGLVIERQLEVVPRTGKPTLVSLFVLAHASAVTARAHAIDTLVVRERDGRWTEDFRRVRSDMGMPPGRHD
jgi:tRNA1(Val) A37 N6-methylase TrmN6